MATYSEKLKDPRWQKKRLEILQRDGFKCVWCGDTKSTLHVHHEGYVGRDPWDTPEKYLHTLCQECHEIEHLEYTELERCLLDLVRIAYKGNPLQMRLVNNSIRLSKEGK